MTEDATQKRTTEPPLLVQRPGILVGLIGAVIALSALAVWPADYYVFARYALMASAGLLAVFALLGLASSGRKMNLLWLALMVLVGGFWTFTYGDFEHAANMIADVVTAAAFLAAGFLIDRQSKLRTTGVVVILLIGAVAAVLGFSERLSAQQAWQECIEEIAPYDAEGEDPVEYCASVMYPSDE